MTASRNLSLRVLGPLILESAGRPLALPTAKAAALVAWLALDGPAPRSRIAAALWPAVDAASARRNLRRELARLREAGAGELLVSEGERLALHAAVELDTRQFAADTAAARDDAALALWRGPVADGLALPDAPAFEDLLAGARQRLARQRMAALEAHAQACEARGEGAAALRAIESLLAEDPLQEAHQRTAMRLHAAAGRRAAALAGYERFAALLADALGVAPMADTAELARTLRNADAPQVTAAPTAPVAPSLQTHVTSAAFEAPTLLPFVGRDAEWARLDEAWRSGVALVIEGPAGIGKTRMATEFCGARGAFALAACRSGDAQLPYAAFTRALRQLAGQSLRRTLDDGGWPHWLRDELAHVLPELGPAVQRIDSEAGRQRFFEACAEAWSRLAGDSFDTVIVDDWHLADAPSRTLLDFIIRGRVAAGGEGARELLLLRSGLLPAERAPIDALARDGVAVHLNLAPLSRHALEALASRIAVDASAGSLARRLAQASGGNPLAVAETLRHWAALSLPAGLEVGGDDSSLPPADEHVRATVQATVLERAAALPETARRLLEAAALASEPFTPALLAGACALSEVQALGAVEAAMAAHLLRERDGGIAFTHDLVQAAIEGAIGADRKRLVHRRLALGAEALRGTTAVAMAEIARHWEAGGELARAVEPRLAAADAALALFSEEAAEQHWAQALVDGASLAQQVAIAARRGAMARDRDDRDAMQAAVAELDRLREACTQHPATADSGLDAAIEAADLLTLMRDSTPALERIDAVLAALPPLRPGETSSAQLRRATAMLVRSQALNSVGRCADGAAVAEAALAGAELPPRLQGRLLHSLVYAHFLDSRIEQALAGAERTLLLWRAVGHRRSMARAHANIGLMHSLLGRHGLARREMGLAVELASEMRMHELRREQLLNLAYIDLHEGQPQAALDRLAAAWDAAPAFSQSSSPVYIRGMQVHGHAFLGQLDQAFDCAEDGHRHAAHIDATDAITDCVSMTLDLASDTGDYALADLWRARLPADAVMPPQYRTKLAFNLVHLALVRGELAAAEAGLAALGDVAALSQPYDRGYAALRHAEVGLARGDAAGALAWVERGHGDATHIEAQTLMLAARVRALRLLHGQGDAACAQAIAEAQSLLAGPATVPALAALELRGACGLPRQAEIERLAASLDNRPAARERFIARWSGPGLQR